MTKAGANPGLRRNPWTQALRRVADIAWIASVMRSITTCMSLPTPSSTRTVRRSIFSPSTSATFTIDSVVDWVSLCS